MADIFDMADTWNDGATTFTAIKMDVTNTASASGSLLMDLQVGSTSKFKVDKDGKVTTASTSIVLGLYTLTTLGTDRWTTGMNFGSYQFRLDPSNGIVMKRGNLFAFSTNSYDAVGSWDARLYSDAANAFDQRNGTNAQTFNIYNTYTDASNYERGFLKWNTNVLEIGTAAAGTGTARVLALQTAGTDRLQFDTTGSMELTTALTVATLPGTPAVGMIARVTDANAPAVGSTVAGSGAAAALVWYNGSNWTVIGV